MACKNILAGELVAAVRARCALAHVRTKVFAKADADVDAAGPMTPLRTRVGRLNMVDVAEVECARTPRTWQDRTTASPLTDDCIMCVIVMMAPVCVGSSRRV
jgi:hypothetical protein